MGYNTFMAGFNDGTISIDIVPDGDGFQLKLDKILNATSGSVELKPDVAKLASNVKKAAKLIPAIEIKATIDPNLTKGSLSGLKTKVEQALGGFSDKVGNNTYKIRPNVELDVRFTETSLKKLKGSVNGAFRNVETSAESGTRKITASANIGVKFTETSLRGLKRDVKNVFKKEQVDLATGKKIKVVAPIDIKAELDFSQNKANKFRTDVRRKISGVTGDGTKGQKYNIKLGSELSVPSAANIRLTKSILLEKFGVVKLPVVTVGRTLAINNAGAGVASAAVNSGTAKSIAINGAAAKSVKGLADANSGLNGTLRSIGQAQQASRGSFTSFIGGVNLAKVAIIGLSVGLGRAAYSFIKFGIESSKGIQQTDLALRSFLQGNQAATTAFIKQMQNFAAVSPFNLEGVLKTSKLLLGAGQNVNKILPELKAIGGLGAQLGVGSDGIERVSLAIAKIAGQGKVTSRELRSIFTAFPGFQPIQALADNLEGFGGSTQKVLTAMSKGAVDANSAIDALIKGMWQFPGAATALYKQSLLLAGSQETLQDRFAQVARSTTGPALAQLALNYRDAAEVFNQQAKTGLGSGIRSLIRDGSDFIPILAKGIVPVLDTMSGAVASLLPGVKDLFSGLGGAGLESLKAFVSLAPALGSGLSLFSAVVTPLAPIVTAFAKAIQLIPTPLIALAGGLKLLGSVSGGAGSKGILGRLFGGKVDENGVKQIGFFKKSVDDVGRGLSKIPGTAKAGSFALGNLFNYAGVKQYNEEVSRLQSKISTLRSGPQSSANGIFGTSTSTQIIQAKAELGKLEASTVTFGQKLKGTFSAGFGGLKSLLGSIGPQLALTAGLAGAGALFEKYQSIKAEAKQVTKETTLIGKELSLDSSALTGADRLIDIIHKLATETEIAAKNIARIGEGFKNIDTSNLAPGKTKDTLNALKSGLEENGLASVIADNKGLEAVKKELEKQADGLHDSGGFLNIDSATAAIRRTGLSNTDSGNSALAAERALTAVNKTYDEYAKSAKKSVGEELRIAKELGDKGLIKTFTKAQKDLEAGVDPSKIYDDTRDSISKLTIEQANLDDSALKAALSGKGLSDQMKKSSSATTAFNDATDELNTTLSELILNQDNISADTVIKATDPTVLGGLSSQFASLAGDPVAQTDFLKQINGQVLELTNDPTAAAAITKHITSWKDAASAALVDFKKSFVDSLPNISSIFSDSFDIDQGPGLDAIGKNFTKSTDTVLEYSKNLAKLQANGFGELAGIFASQGTAGANAAAEAVLKLNADGTSKTLTELQGKVDTYNGAIKTAGTSITDTAKQYVGKQFNINPNLIVDPSLTVNTPSQADIDAAGARLAEINVGITAKRDELIAKNKTLKRFGEKTVNVDQQLKDDPLYSGVIAEQAKLQAFLDGAKKQIFADLETQATTTATAINTSFSDAKIDVAIQPQVDNAAKELSAIPQKIKDTFGADFKANSVLALTGNSIGKGFVDGIKVGLDAQLLLVSEPIRVQFRTLGQQIAESIAYGFGVGNDAITNAIKKPFNDASTPLNSFFGTLVAASKAVGISASFAPIPQFHTGGIAGEKAVTHNGRFTRDEMLAVVKKKEGILPETSMKKLGKARFEMLRRGEFGDGPGINGEALANYSTDKDRVAINQAKDNYFSRYRKTDISGPLNKRMADKIVESYAFASLKKLDEIQAKVDAANINGANVPGVISSGEVYNSLLAAKGKFGSFITLIKAMRGTGMPFGVSSTVRPGAITASGNRSLHGVARAVDFTGTGPQMLKMARWWAQYGPVLAELIHTPMGFGYKNGKKVSSFGSVVDKGHYNHGHVALFRGGLVKGSSGGIMANIGERGQSEAVLPLGQPDRMASIISHAIRSGEMSESGQRAIANVIGQGQTTNHNVTNQEVTVNVVAPVKDAELQGTIIQHRVSAALKGM